MATDGENDYSGYTAKQLEEAAENIDRVRYPINAQRLRDAQERIRAATVAESEAAGDWQLYQFEFRADGKEYFRIWIVNLALTIATLGIYSAWAKVRRLNYFYGNTSLAGSAFGYHADPVKILKGRAIAAVAVISYFAATRYSITATLIVIGVVASAMPWLIVRSRMFAMRMTSWRGVRFGFQRDYAGAYQALLGWLAVGFVTFGIMMPYALRERYAFVVGRTRFGTTQFRCDPDVNVFYTTTFAVGGMALVIAAFAAVVAMGVGRLLGLADGSAGHTALMGQMMTLLTYVPIYAVVHGYTQSRILNEVLGKSTLGNLRVKCQLRARPLMWIYLTNLLGIVFTLGFYAPWAQVRLARYRFASIAVNVHGTLDAFAGATADPVVSAAGGEISEFFDFDFGF